MENQGIPQLPPGVRFNPTEEELFGYLKKWVNFEPDTGFIFIPAIYPRMEPWDIKAIAKRLGHEDQEEWYYFVLIKRKYATGTKIDRTTKAGYWKASGSDKAVFSKNGEKIGIRTSFCFHTGRAPRGTRTNWTTYEYRLLIYPHGPPDQPQEHQEWVVCKGLKKSPAPSNSTSIMHHNDPPNPMFNQTSSLDQVTFNPPHHDQDSLISAQIGFENQLLDEPPQLRGIPNTNSTMFGTTQDQGLYVQSSIAYNMSANNEEERSKCMIDPATSSYSFHDVPLPPTTSHYDKNYMSQVPEGNPTMYTSHHDQNYMNQVPEGNPTRYTSHHDQNYMSQVPEGNPTRYTSHHDQNYMSQMPKGNPTMYTSHHDQNYMSQVPEGNPTMYTSHHDQNYMSQVPEGNPTMYTSHHDQNYMSQEPEGNPTMYTSHHDQNYMSQVPEGNPTMYTSHHDQNYMSQVPEGNPIMYTSHHDQNYMSQVPEGNTTMYTSHHDQNYISQMPEGNPTMYISHHDQNYISHVPEGKSGSSGSRSRSYRKIAPKLDFHDP